MAITTQQVVEALSQSGLWSETELAALQNGGAAQSGEVLVAELVNQNKLTSYQASVLSQGQSRGLVFGEYVVLDKLGEGGMGVVYKAQQRRLKRTVALKVLNPTLTKTESLVKRFHREVEAVARLNHANIVVAYDANEQDGVHYLVMEFVDGPDLAHVVKTRGPLPVAKALSYIEQAARGLAHAHAKGLVHRDIKPSNLLLSNDGRVKILDLGLARFTDIAVAAPGVTSPEELTQTGHIMGTCDYMAPEQAMDSKEADQRSDIYSLGCTLYYLLTGEAPYGGASSMKKLLAHRDNPIPSLREARPEAPLAVNVVFQRMLAKNPQDRYQSMTDVRRALKALRRKPTTAKQRKQQSAREETARLPTLPAAAPAAVPGPGKMPYLGALLMLAAIAIIITTFAAFFHPNSNPSTQEKLAAAVALICVAAAAVFSLGLRAYLGGPLDVPFLGTLAGGLVGGMGGVGAGFFFGQMGRSGWESWQSAGVILGTALGALAGAVLRLRLVGTLACALAAGIAAWCIGGGNAQDGRSLAGALGFAPVGALMGAVLAYRTIQEQLKGNGDKRGFWSAP